MSVRPSVCLSISLSASSHALPCTIRKQISHHAHHNSSTERLSYARFNVEEIEMELHMDRLAPYESVLLQEVNLVNHLVEVMLRSLDALSLGLVGKLRMTAEMQQLQRELGEDRVPTLWAQHAFPSLRSLGSWIVDLKNRLEHLQECVERGLELPMVTWLGAFFHPQSFLTAVLQTHAREEVAKAAEKTAALTGVAKLAAKNAKVQYRGFEI